MFEMSRTLAAVALVAMAGAAAAAEPQGSAAGGAVSLEPAPEAAVLAVFGRYKDAALRDEGEAVAALVTPESVAHYGRLARAARGEGAPTLADAPRHVDRMQVEMLRKLVGPEKLAAMTSRGAVVYAFEGRMLGEEFETSSTLDRVLIEGDSATARHVARGRPVGAPYREATLRFVRVEGEWRVDLLHTLDLMEAQLHDLVASSGEPVEEVAERIVGMFTGEAYVERLEELRRQGVRPVQPEAKPTAGDP